MTTAAQPPRKPTRKPTRRTPPKAIGPGRPKDLSKRAAILDAAETLFVQYGFSGVSMDRIARKAGVSKLTLYSHFGDKDGLFAEAVHNHCARGVPTHLFDPDPSSPLRERLLAIGTAFFTMVMAPDALAGHRILCSPQATGSRLPEIFWNAGVVSMRDAFASMLQRRVDNGELSIANTTYAADHFFAMTKGAPHARAIFGLAAIGGRDAAKRHIADVVEVFLRAYATPTPVQSRRNSR